MWCLKRALQVDFEEPAEKLPEVKEEKYTDLIIAEAFSGSTE